jgi:hypothetical protein
MNIEKKLDLDMCVWKKMERKLERVRESPTAHLQSTYDVETGWVAGVSCS